MPRVLQSEEAFAYMQRRLAEKGFKFSYTIYPEINMFPSERRRYCRSIHGCFKLYCTPSDVRMYLVFDLQGNRRHPNFLDVPFFSMEFAHYYPSIKASGYRGDLTTLARLLDASPEEILVSNQTQKIKDEERYKKTESLTFLREEEPGITRYDDFRRKLELTFKAKGRDFNDTSFAIKDLDLIVNLFGDKIC